MNTVLEPIYNSDIGKGFMRGHLSGFSSIGTSGDQNLICFSNVESANINLRSSIALIIGMNDLGISASKGLADSGMGNLLFYNGQSTGQPLPSSSATDSSGEGMDKGAASDVEKLAALRERNLGVFHYLLPNTIADNEWSSYILSTDVVVFCSDNERLRYQISYLCFKYRIPLVLADSNLWEGTITASDFRHEETPCFYCFTDSQESTFDSGVGAGNTVDEISIENSFVQREMGRVQAHEALNLLLSGTPSVGRVLFFDALKGEWIRMNLPKNPHCPLCGKKYTV